MQSYFYSFVKLVSWNTQACSRFLALSGPAWFTFLQLEYLWNKLTKNRWANNWLFNTFPVFCVNNWLVLQYLKLPGVYTYSFFFFFKKLIMHTIMIFFNIWIDDHTPCSSHNDDIFFFHFVTNTCWSLHHYGEQYLIKSQSHAQTEQYLWD